jgi:acyl-CoA synthetase (AMP-forming)/AMP-acid ligase II
MEQLMTSDSLDYTLGDIVRRNAVRFAGVPAYIADKAVLTHGQLYDRGSALVAALAGIGLGRQDRIAILGRNSIRFGEVLAAGQLGGLIVATVNFRLAAAEMRRIITDAAPRVVFVDTEFLPVVTALRAEIGLELIISLDGEDGSDDETPGLDRTDVVSYPDFIDPSLGADLPFAARGHDIACLIYTSGTTGKPKGAILGQREMFACAHTMNVEMRTGSTDRALLVMPLFHIGAMAIGLGLHARGGAAVLHRQFEPATALQAAVDDQITVLHLAPTMLQALIHEATAGPAANSSESPLAKVQTVVYSAAPITGPVLAAAMAAMPSAGFLNLYGQTEVITSGLPRELHSGEGAVRERRLTSVGYPFPDNKVRIVADSGQDCPPGEPGEIVVASPAMFRGYWNDSAATATTLRDGWCHTGDVGLFDEEGLLHLVDRKKDVIISGGENIYSLEVEEAVVSHPSVAQCVVIGVPDERWGESVCAVIVPAAGATIDLDTIRGHVQERLARYKAPRSVVILDELPILPTGKFDKKALRARYQLSTI